MGTVSNSPRRVEAFRPCVVMHTDAVFGLPVNKPPSTAKHNLRNRGILITRDLRALCYHNNYTVTMCSGVSYMNIELTS